ncbi:MAG TPA: nucleotide exchange factor GrpE [Polyangia bacterium]
MGNDESETNGGGQGEAPAQPTLEQQIDQLEKLEQEKRELHDRLLRTAADFENFKKRTKKEADEASIRGREQLLKELLPALDNLERALKHAPAGDPLAVGVQQTEKQLLQALEKFGVVRFAAVGKPFDPSLHDAIQQVETNEYPPGTVAQEFASGYMLGPRLLRAALVAVAKAPAGDAPPTVQ